MYLLEKKNMIEEWHNVENEKDSKQKKQMVPQCCIYRIFDRYKFIKQ